MKNIDYIRLLPADKLAQLIASSVCDKCSYDGRGCTDHAAMNCFDGVKAWCEEEHKEDGDENKT